MRGEPQILQFIVNTVVPRVGSYSAGGTGCGTFLSQMLLEGKIMKACNFTCAIVSEIKDIDKMFLNIFRGPVS